MWSLPEQALYWSDIDEQFIYRYHLETAHLEKWKMPSPVGSMGFVSGGGLILAVKDGFALWDGVSNSVQTMAKTIAPESPCMMNDGKVDPQGRFWAGSKGPKGLSALWMAEGNKLRKVLTGLGIANGLDWIHHSFYFTDSLEGKIYRFDYEPVTGKIKNRTLFYEAETGVPDGLSLDREGNVWTAIWDGWKILQISPSGTVLQEIQMPVQRPTSVCFGGPDLQTLFITSARVDLSDQELSLQPLAGDVFAMQTEVPGRPANLYINYAQS